MTLYIDEAARSLGGLPYEPARHQTVEVKYEAGWIVYRLVSFAHRDKYGAHWPQYGWKDGELVAPCSICRAIGQEDAAPDEGGEIERWRPFARQTSRPPSVRR